MSNGRQEVCAQLKSNCLWLQKLSKLSLYILENYNVSKSTVHKIYKKYLEHIVLIIYEIKNRNVT